MLCDSTEIIHYTLCIIHCRLNFFLKKFLYTYIIMFEKSKDFIMTNGIGLFFTLTSGLTVALILGYIAHKIKLSPLVGYLIA